MEVVKNIIKQNHRSADLHCLIGLNLMHCLIGLNLTLYVIYVSYDILLYLFTLFKQV